MNDPSTTFLHPWCHLVSGQRLYYILISLESLAKKPDDFLIESLKKSELLESSCAYYVFGSTDILIRSWASARELSKFRQILSKNFEIVNKFEVKMVTHTRTWYQAEIEKKNIWINAVRKDLMKSVRGKTDFSPALTNPRRSTSKLEDLDGSVVKTVKFFVFIEGPYATDPLLYRRAIDLRIWESAKDILNMSIYAYLSDDAQGVIVKGEVRADDFADLGVRILSISEDLAEGKYATTSHICSAPCILENNSFKAKKREHFTEREIIYNLFRSHRCFHPSFDPPQFESKGDKLKRRDYGGGDVQACETRLDDFLQEAASSLWNDILKFHEGWEDSIHHIRLVLRWVVAGRQKNEQLRAVIMLAYADLEEHLRSILQSSEVVSEYFEERLNKTAASIAKFLNGKQFNMTSGFDSSTIPAIQQFIEGKFVDKSRKLMYSDMLICLKSIENRLPVEEKELIREFVGLLENSVKDRNLLMHGAVNHLFSTGSESEDDEKWRTVVFNYLRIYILKTSAISLISKNVA